jgi:signal transduction histidine kinase
MRTRLLPPSRVANVAGWGAPLAAALAPLTAAAQPQTAVISSGPWLLAVVLLVLAVVVGLACALGYAWGRRVSASNPTVQAVDATRPADAPRKSLASGPAQTADQGSTTADVASPATAAAAPEPTPAPAPAPGPDEALSFSYTVSHDLRAPVRVVDGFARILKEDYSRQMDRIANDHLDRILAAASRMNAMIDAMLSLAQLTSQPLARQPVNLSQLAAYILEDLRRAQPERVVQADIEPDLLVLGDPTLMRQLMENLLSNAWKYTGKAACASIQVRATQQDGQRVFEVSDNGAGFDMRSAERLFGLFQRLHSANDFPGTGVGLASVQRIVRRHGGDIWAESQPGQGSRFCFTIKT